MRYTILFSIILFTILTGCKKGKFGSAPTLKFKSVSSTIIPINSGIQFTLSFTDGAGNLSDSIYIQKVEPNCFNSNFAINYGIPSFPTSKDEQGDILVNFRYIDISPQCQVNDTAVFRFAIRDKANHASDTVSSPPIIIFH